MRKLLLASALFLIGICAAFGQGYEKKSFTAADGTALNYRLLAPEAENGEKYPLVLFLHGAGERGNDNEIHLLHGSQMFLNPVNRDKYPAYVLFPQCPSEGYWAFLNRPDSFTEMTGCDDITPVLQAVMELVHTYLENPLIDKSRVYVMGISMGGMATYDLVARFPETFAAAIPICGAVNPERLSVAEGVNFRIYHGDADPIVPVECSRIAYRALKKAGVDVEYKEFPGCGHDSWNPAFNQPDFMEWLFKQKKSRKYMK